MVMEVLSFQCSKCKNLHSSELKARICCKIDTQSGFKCDRCSAVYYSQLFAKDCSCLRYDPDEKLKVLAVKMLKLMDDLNELLAKTKGRDLV